MHHLEQRVAAAFAKPHDDVTGWRFLKVWRWLNRGLASRAALLLRSLSLTN